MPRRPRRRRASPNAEIWEILRSIAREDRIARRRLATLEERFRKEREARERRAREQEAKYREEREAWELRGKQQEAKYREEREAWELREKQQEAKYRQEAEDRRRAYEAAAAARSAERAERDSALREAEEARREEQARLERRLNKIAGDADNRWGRLMEALVDGDLMGLLQGAGIEVVEPFGRLRSRIGGVWREYDLAAVGELDVVVVEVKTTLRPSDVQRFTERIADFRRWRPFEARERVWGALAYLGAEGDAIPAAEAAGFYLIRAVGGNARMANSEGFEPRVF